MGFEVDKAYICLLGAFISGLFIGKLLFLILIGS